MTAQKAILFLDAAGDGAKRVRTRALLMDCAIAEFAEKGINRASVDDIATRAKVSHGTFYYHFANKTEIVEAVGRAVAAGFVNIVDREIREVSSGPERVALATQVFIDMARMIPNWGWLVVDALANMGTFHSHISRGIRKDVLIGIRGGDFRGEPSAFVFNSLLAVVGTAIRARLERPEDRTVAPRAAELILLMLGVPIEVAALLPGEVVTKHALGKRNTPDTIRRDLDKIMPLLLQEILLDQEGLTAPQVPR